MTNWWTERAQVSWIFLAQDLLVYHHSATNAPTQYLRNLVNVAISLLILLAVPHWNAYRQDREIFNSFNTSVVVRIVAHNTLQWIVLEFSGMQQSWPCPNWKKPRVLHIFNQSYWSQRSIRSCPCIPSFINTGNCVLGGSVTHGIRFWVWISDVTSPCSQVAVKGKEDEMYSL